MIFYFSGTGNSKHVAKSIIQKTDERCVAITEDLIQTKETYYLDETERVGFIFPVYWYSLPKIVEKFLKQMNLEGYQSQYVYAIATYGIAGGKVMNQLAYLLEKKDLPLKGKFGVKMIDNYVVGYPLAGEERQKIVNREADAKIEEMKAEIKKRKEIEMFHKGKIAFLSPITGYAYRNTKHTHKFYAADTCNGCGLCEKNCPCNVIRLTDGKPKWEGDCTFCLKCIHSCNKAAIQYGAGTLKRKRYQYVEENFFS